MQKGYRFNPLVPANMLQEKIIYMPGVSENFNSIVADYISLFNASCPLYLIERYEGYFDSFHFSGMADNQNIINVYLNNLDVLEKFKFYFKEKAKKIIDKASINKIFIPEPMQPCFKGLTSRDEIKSDSWQDVSEQIAVKRYFLSGKYEGISLTQREVEILGLLTTGGTVKEIARLANLSPRTVETYLANVKNKLGLYRRSELIKLVFDFKLLSS